MESVPFEKRVNRINVNSLSGWFRVLKLLDVWVQFKPFLALLLVACVAGFPVEASERESLVDCGPAGRGINLAAIEVQIVPNGYERRKRSRWLSRG